MKYDDYNYSALSNESIVKKMIMFQALRKVCKRSVCLQKLSDTKCSVVFGILITVYLACWRFFIEDGEAVVTYCNVSFAIQVK